MLVVFIFLLFLLFFNMLFFLIGGTAHSAAVWTSYSFIHISYLCFALSCFGWKLYKGNVALSTPVCYVSMAYFILSFLFNMVMILIRPEGNKFNLAVNLILLFLYLLLALIYIYLNKRIINKG